MTQEALKLALDALETELSIDWTNNDEFNASAEKMHEAIVAIKAALAQPEQMHLACIEYIPCCTDKTCPKCKAAATLQRTFVGLTDVEIEQAIELISMLHGDYATEVAYAIEAKLKEKNT